MRFVAAIVLIALTLPELPRYRGERRLGGLTGFMRLVVMRTDLASRRDAALHRISLEAERTRTYPGDWRPWITAANASLLARDNDRAVVLLERALREGERPEVLANLGIALVANGERDRGSTALLRAAWISPGLIPVIAKRTNIHLYDAIAQREQSWAVPSPVASEPESSN